MSEPLLHPSASGPLKSSDEIAKALDEACRNLATLLTSCSDSAAVRRELLARVPPRVLTLLEGSEPPAPPVPNPKAADVPEIPGPAGDPPDFVMTPEFLEWARQLYSVEELIAGYNELKDGGGLELRDFIHELEEAARDDG